MDNRALGKGLSALIPEKSQSAEGADVSSIRTSLIKDNVFQPRTDYDEEKLDELKASIKEKGVLQPILIRKKDDGYEVIAGERRLKAARALGLEEIPAVVKDVTDREALVLALVENIQREELNPIEEAEAYKKLIEDFEYTHDNVARSVGKNRSTITNLMRLLNLPRHMQKGVYEGTLSVGHARTLLGIDSLTEKERLYEMTISKGLSVRELENLSKQQNKTGSRREKNKESLNHEILAIEEELQKALGTKVRIKPSKKRGKIVIDYYSQEDLDRVIHIIKK